MNQYIVKQLQSCKVADVPVFNETDLQMIIPRKDLHNVVAFVEGHYYFVELEDYIINPPDNFTLHINWNRGIIPTSKYLKLCITQRMGSMVKIDGVGCNIETGIDSNDSYIGLWLPADAIKIIKEI